jgi:hypothetical protein
MQSDREHKVKINANLRHHDIHESIKLQYMQLAELECQALAEEAKIEKDQRSRVRINSRENPGVRDFPWLSDKKPLVPPPRPPRASLSRARGSRPTLTRSTLSNHGNKYRSPPCDGKTEANLDLQHAVI